MGGLRPDPGLGAAGLAQHGGPAGCTVRRPDSDCAPLSYTDCDPMGSRPGSDSRPARLCLGRASCPAPRPRTACPAGQRCLWILPDFLQALQRLRNFFFSSCLQSSYKPFTHKPAQRQMFLFLKHLVTYDKIEIKYRECFNKFFNSDFVDCFSLFFFYEQ